jgi:hypothetical protein
MRDAGLKPTKLTNAWVPFVVASALALKDGGRLGMVVPAELLQVTYAAELRAFLVDRFKELTAVACKKLVFDGSCRRSSCFWASEAPARQRSGSPRSRMSNPSPPPMSSWPFPTLLPCFVQRLGDLVDVDVGVVTGRNRFFVVSPSDGTERACKITCRRSSANRLIFVASDSPKPITRTWLTPTQCADCWPSQGTAT